LRGGRTAVTAPKPVGFPVSEARLVGVGSIFPVDATNPRTLSVDLSEATKRHKKYIRLFCIFVPFCG